MLERSNLTSLSTCLDGLGSNLLAELVGTLFTVLVLEEIMKRAERHSEQRKRWREATDRQDRDVPTWRELSFSFVESLETLARAWEPISPGPAEVVNDCYYVGLLRQEVARGGAPLQRRPLPGDLSKLANTFLAVAGSLFALHSMFPNGALFARHFIDLSYKINTLKTKLASLQQLQDRRAASKGEKSTALGKAIYIRKGALVLECWQIFNILAMVSEKIETELDSPPPNLNDFAVVDPPTWLELAASGAKNLARRISKRLRLTRVA